MHRNRRKAPALLALFTACCCAVAAAAVAAAAPGRVQAPEAAAGAAGAPRAAADFSGGEAPPEAAGVEWDGRGFGPAGGAGGAWAARQGSAQEPWRRSVRLRVSDPRLTGGKMPAVDVEVEYRTDAPQTPVRLLADTAAGVRVVAEQWNGGGGEGWRTLRASLDDARFSRRVPADGEAAGPEGAGWDLRLDGFNRDLEVRRVSVRGHDLEVAPDWRRLLRLERIETGAPHDLLLLRPRPGGREAVTFRLRNNARRPLAAEYTYALSDWSGRPRQRGSGAAEVAGGASEGVAVPLLTGGLRYGVYRLSFAVRRKGSPAGEPPLLEREAYVGVASPAKLPKARDGEFLYGLDVKLGAFHEDPRLLRWMEEMGVDIVRGGGFHADDPARVAEALPKLEAAGLRVMAMVDPPRDADPARRRADLERKRAAAAEVARRFPSLVYWEMGNEPDLTFFYPGPPEDYAADYADLARAVKAANPKAVVMNGGLCFAGPEGDRRARRLVELLDPAALDAWAYHGHGPGAQSERDALERMRRAARRWDKHRRPFVETESGVAARTPAQETAQARTAVQKLVYAQSERLPLLMWFRLYMFEEDYGSLKDAEAQQPRPAVLSYRATVEALRGLRFVRTLDLREGVEAYLFAEPGVGGRRACALWTSRPGAVRTASLVLGPAAAGARAPKDVRLRDLFGNATPLPLLPGGNAAAAAVAQVTVTESPCIVTWRAPASQPASAVRPTARRESPLRTAAVAQVVGGGDGPAGAGPAATPIYVTVRNPLPRPAAVTLRARAGRSLPVEVAPIVQTLRLGPGEERRVSLRARPRAQGGGGVAWPRAWVVFPHVDPAKADPAALRAVPESLPGEDGGPPVAGRRVVPADDGTNIDLTRAGGRVRERAMALVLGEVQSDADRTVTVGASADWWMAWYVNGEKAFDTLRDGNGGPQGITAHTFPLRLKRGRNLVAVSVLSGSQGWRLVAGGPEALRRARAAGGGGEGGAEEDPAAGMLSLSLSAGDVLLSRELVEVRYNAPVAPLPAGLSLASPAAEWERAAAPDAVLDDGRGVVNLFDREPDAARWWKGPEDLSARAWLRADGSSLYLRVEARDAQTAPGDALRFVLARPDGATLADLTVPGARGGGEGARGLPSGATATAERDGDVTVYRVAVPRRALGAAAADLLVNFAVTDADTPDGARKQYLEWRPGLIAPPGAAGGGAGAAAGTEGWTRTALPPAPSGRGSGGGTAAAAGVKR